MQLLLARHGNTFESSRDATWIGRKTDLPLVASGREQARSLAEALRRSGIELAAIYSGLLRRSAEFARLVAEGLELDPPAVDPRLDELDYGDWEGLTAGEITARGGGEELRAWREQSRWPSDAGWSGSPEAVRREVEELAAELGDLYAGETVLVVSSNGRLRYFLTLVPGELERRIERRDFAVRTGRVCKLVSDGSGYEVMYWNVDPREADAL